MCGFKRSSFDTCVYLREVAACSYVFLLLYVEEKLIACQAKYEISQVKNSLPSEFDMKDLGPARKILGMEIMRNRKSKTLFLSQKRYLTKVLQKFGMVY